MTLWAVDYEPRTGENASADSGSERVLRLATAGGVWTYFALMRDRRGLRDQDFAEKLGTNDWQSYADLQVGLDTSGSQRTRLTMGHYARALDHDPSNLLADFNLAGKHLELARSGGPLRLTAYRQVKSVHESIEALRRRSGEEAEHSEWHEVERRHLRRWRGAWVVSPSWKLP